MDKNLNEPKSRYKPKKKQIIIEDNHPILKSCFKNSVKIIDNEIDNIKNYYPGTNIEINNFESIKRSNLINYENKKVNFELHKMNNELFEKNNTEEKSNIHEDYIKNKFNVKVKLPRIKNNNELNNISYTENNKDHILWRNLYNFSPENENLGEKNSFLNIRLKNIKEKQDEFKKRQEKEKIKNEELIKEYLDFKKK